MSDSRECALLKGAGEAAELANNANLTDKRPYGSDRGKKLQTNQVDCTVPDCNSQIVFHILVPKTGNEFKLEAKKINKSGPFCMLNLGITKFRVVRSFFNVSLR